MGKALFIEFHMPSMQVLELRKALKEAMEELTFIHPYQFAARADLELLTRSCRVGLVGVTGVAVWPFVLVWVTSRGSCRMNCGPG